MRRTDHVVRRRGVVALSLSLICLLFAEVAQCGETLAAVSAPDGRLEIFEIGDSGNRDLRHVYQRSSPPYLGPVNWIWKRHAFLAGVSDTVAGKDFHGRLYVAAIKDGRIRVMAQSFPGSEFNTLSTLSTYGLHGLKVATNADGRVEFFALADNGSVWSVAQTGTDGWNTANRFLGNLAIKEIFPATQKDGRLGLIALETNGRGWWRSQVVPNGDWGEWTSLGGEDLALKHLVAAGDTDGRAEVFGLREDGALYRNAQAPIGGWSGWARVNAESLKAPLILAQNEDGRLELFARDTSNLVVHSWQISRGGPWMNGFEVLDTGAGQGHEATDLAVTTRYGRLVLIARIRRTYAYLSHFLVAHQSVPNGRFVEWSRIPAE